MDSSISDLGHIYCWKWWFQSQINKRMGNRVDPDEMACYKLSHLDLRCKSYSHFCSKNINAFENTLAKTVVIS